MEKVIANTGSVCENKLMQIADIDTFNGELVVYDNNGVCEIHITNNRGSFIESYSVSEFLDIWYVRSKELHLDSCEYQLIKNAVQTYYNI